MAKVARLLEKIVPERYRLKIDVDMEKFRFAAVEQIEFELKHASRELMFHAVGLDITKISLDEDDSLKADGVHLDKEVQTVTLTLPREAAAGKHRLVLEFTGEIQDSLHGFYRSGYKHEGKQKWLAATQFEPISAREAFVCIDEPSAKAVFELTLVVPEGLQAISNTQIKREVAVGHGRKQVEFEPTPIMSTYLLAYLVGEFEYV